MLTHRAVTALIQKGLKRYKVQLCRILQTYHCTLAGYVHSWIQLTSDGLAQKAGCPQALVNDIHGSWFDPSNPVIVKNGCIRFPRL